MMRCLGVICTILVLLGSVWNVKSEETVCESDLPELRYLDESVNPCDNFYQFSCGKFRNYHPLPSGALVIDHFTLLEDELIKIGNEILSVPRYATDPVALNKAKAAYQACVDTDYADNLSTPELDIVNRYGGMPLLQPSADPSLEATKFSWNDIGDMVGEFGVPMLFQYSIIPQMAVKDDFYIYTELDPLQNPSFVRPNPRRAYDDVLSEDFKEQSSKLDLFRATAPAPFDVFLRTVSRRLIEKVTPGKSDDDMIQDLDDMATFMRQLYAGGIVDENIKNTTLSFFPTLRELQNWTDTQFGPNNAGIDWVEYMGRVFGKSGVNITENVALMVVNSRLIYGVLNLVRQTNPNVLKNFALLRLFLFLAPDSDGATRQAFEDYYNAKQLQLYPRWEYCTRKIMDASGTASLNFAVAYNYQLYHFDANKITKAASLVQLIQETFKEILHEADWMDDVSRDAALKKVDNILTLLGFPDFVEERSMLDGFYENIRICEWDNYGNSQRLRAFKQAYLFSQLGKPRERSFWDKSAFDANAYYNRANNKIVLPISMLNPVFFRGNVSTSDYGRLGSIIGHEITHGFDSSGQTYNEDGLQKPWWSDDTQTAFDERKVCFQDQYSQYFIPELGKNVDGVASLDENLADNGGLRGSYKAFQKLKTRKKLVSKPSCRYTLDQLFFISYATTWCDQTSATYLATYPNYSPNRYRVNGPLSNLQEFSATFGCPAGSPMNPENKCILW